MSYVGWIVWRMMQPWHARTHTQACQRYWTSGGTLRNVPPGSGRRKSKAASSKAASGGSGRAAKVLCCAVQSCVLLFMLCCRLATHPTPPFKLTSLRAVLCCFVSCAVLC
jgi:hypothetical protein